MQWCDSIYIFLILIRTPTNNNWPHVQYDLTELHATNLLHPEQAKIVYSFVPMQTFSSLHVLLYSLLITAHFQSPCSSSVRLFSSSCANLATEFHKTFAPLLAFFLFLLSLLLTAHFPWSFAHLQPQFFLFSANLIASCSDDAAEPIPTLTGDAALSLGGP